MKFEIDNPPANLFKLTTAQKKILDYVESMKDGKLIKTRTLAEQLNYSVGTIQENMASSIFNENKVSIKRFAYWGNKKTVKAFREEYGL